MQKEKKINHEINSVLLKTLEKYKLYFFLFFWVMASGKMKHQILFLSLEKQVYNGRKLRHNTPDAEQLKTHAVCERRVASSQNKK